VVVFSDHRDAIPHALFCRSFDEGFTWESMRVDDTDSFQSGPEVAVLPSGGVVVVWSDLRWGRPQVYVATLDSLSGDHFDSGHRPRPTQGLQTGSSLAIDDTGVVHLAWIDWASGQPDVYYGRSTDSGATFDIQAVETFQARRQNLALTVTPGGSPFVAWLDYRFGLPNPFVAHSRDGGNTFPPAQRVWSISAQSVFTIAAGTDGTAHLVFRDSGLGYIYSDPAGEVWDPNDYVILPAGPGITQTSPDMCVDHRDRIFVAWQDGLNGIDPPDLFGCFSLDGGDRFRGSYVVYEGLGRQNNPSVAVDGNGALHFAWQDTNDGNTWIYYRRTRQQ
jgi:hypothetical protein